MATKLAILRMDRSSSTRTAVVLDLAWEMVSFLLITTTEGCRVGTLLDTPTVLTAQKMALRCLLQADLPGVMDPVLVMADIPFTLMEVKLLVLGSNHRDMHQETVARVATVGHPHAMTLLLQYVVSIMTLSYQF